MWALRERPLRALFWEIPGYVLGLLCSTFFFVFLLPILIPYLVIFLVTEICALLDKHVLKPIYYFAKYRDYLMSVVDQKEYDERAIKFQGSLEQMNYYDFQSQFPESELHHYDVRFQELQREEQARSNAEQTQNQPSDKDSR